MTDPLESIERDRQLALRYERQAANAQTDAERDELLVRAEMCREVVGFALKRLERKNSGERKYKNIMAGPMGTSVLDTPNR